MVKARLNCAGASDPGLVRHNNEDAWHADPERGIFVVVDGMGGQAAGEKAAAIAVERIRARLERQTGTTEQRIREAITVANNEILQAARGNPEWRGMACVLTLAVLENGSAVIGHVGDSRMYLLQGDGIQKVTHDHSPVGEREDKQEISEAEAMRHPRRNEVFRDVGSEEHTPDDPDWIEVRRIPFEPDAALLLCSDGLSDQVPSADILRIVERNAATPETAVRQLIAAANRAGGKDNVTILLVEGEQFAAAHARMPETIAAPPRSRWPFLLLGLVLGLAAMYGALKYALRWEAPAPPVQTGQILTVGQGQPFARITDALRQARAGDTVEVLAGDYHEQVHLKEGVTVRSRVAREAVLLPVPLSENPVVIADAVKNARISGFLIRADRQAPLSAGILLNNSDVTVEDMEVAGAASGIVVHGGNPTLLGNTVYDCTAEGILVANGSRAWISHNALRRNKTGLAVRDTSHPGVAENVFEKNGVDPADAMNAVKAQNIFLPAPVTPATPAPARTGQTKR